MAINVTKESYIDDVVECSIDFMEDSGVTEEQIRKRIGEKCQWKQNLGEGFVLDESELEEAMMEALGDWVDEFLEKGSAGGYIKMSVADDGDIHYAMSEKAMKHLKKKAS